jgi:hypothetical protein
MRLTQKQSATLQAIFLFFLISNPFTYRLTTRLLSGPVCRLSAPTGCATCLGLVIESAVFGAIDDALMYV